MTQVAETDLDRVLQDLESDTDATRRDGIVGAVRLGERAVRAIPFLQRMAGEEVNPDLRHLARKALYLLAMEAHARAQAAAQQQPAIIAAPGGKSAKITAELAKESIPVLAAKLNSSNPHVRASALRATAIRREKLLLPVLLERLGPEQEPDAELRAIQVRVLAILGEKEQLKGVASFLEDPDAECRAAAVDVLAQYRDVMAFPFIVRSLQDRDPRPQKRAAAALTKVGSVNILKICELMIQSDRLWSRDAAVFCLALTGIPESARILQESLKDPEETVRKKARVGLEKLAEKGVAAAQDALAKEGAPPRTPGAPEPQAAAQLVESRPAEDIASPEPMKRRAATKQLIALEGALDESHLPGLVKRLEVETDVLVLVNLLTAIGRIKKPEVVPVLSRGFVTHANETVRAAAVDALAAQGSPQALEPIKRLLNDPSPVVIGRSLVALREQPGVDLLAELIRMVSHADPRFRTTAIYVITELGEEKLVPLIEQLGRDADSSVASLAQDSAEILAEDIKAKAAAKPRGPRGARPPVASPKSDPAVKPDAAAESAAPAEPAPRPSRKTPVVKPGSRPSGPVAQPGKTPTRSSPGLTRPPGGGALRAAAALLALGGVGWLLVAAWYLSGNTIAGAEMGGAGISLVAGLSGVFVGYAVSRVESWGFTAGLAVSVLHVALGLVQAASGRAALAVLALVGLVCGALLFRERAAFV